jgi:hypothetical protein
VIPLFPDTNAFIYGAIKSGGTVLVHWYVLYWNLQFQNVTNSKLCSDMGISRSVTMVAAYRRLQHPIQIILHQLTSRTAVIQRHSHTAEMALEHLRTCRGFVRPNYGYMEQLKIYSEANCNVVEAGAKWANRKVEITQIDGIARRSPLAFVLAAGPRVSGWFRRKTKRATPDEDRHEKMQVVEPDCQ